MVASATWPLLPTTPTVASEAEDNESRANASLIFLGNGLLRPFVRDEKKDFANASGAALVKSAVGQILGTRCTSPTNIGELPWRPEFGSLLPTLRHANNDDRIRQIAQTFVVDALRRWEPRIRVTGFSINQRSSQPLGPVDTLEIRVEYSIIDRNVPGNNVIISGQQAFVELEIGVQ